MNTDKRTIQAKDRRVILSTLWLFAMFNYLYADVYSLFFNPVLQKELTEKLVAGYAGSVKITEGFVLITAILMETAIVMVLLSRVLEYRTNRWANIISGAFHTLFVAWALVGEAPSLFYVFFAMIEIACTVFIVWYAWKWHNPES